MTLDAGICVSFSRGTRRSHIPTRISAGHVIALLPASICRNNPVIAGAPIAVLKRSSVPHPHGGHTEL